MDVMSHHSQQQLHRLVDREPRSDLAKRLLTVLMIQQGFTAPEVAIYTGVRFRIQGQNGPRILGRI